ncbi:MAG: hypothetical protein WC803_08730 [Sphingomonas sp.]|jgi:hypothetical protein
MTRFEDHPGLSSGDGWRELAYDTGDADWPRARLRITPLVVDQDDRLHKPNADPVPPRVQVRMSASLIDGEGVVERIVGRILLGPESIHSWQFDADAEFDAEAWLNECAARVISDLIRLARGISAANAAGLVIN